MRRRDPKETVRLGYDLVSERYRRADFDFAASGYAKYLAWLNPHLADGARVLDIGCGCGIPVARELAGAGCRVLGVDLSGVQVRRARELVPSAEFVQGDIMEQELPDAGFDAVVAFYSIIHLPPADHREIVFRIARWTRPGGVFLGTVGGVEDPGSVEDDWLDVPGATMYWSHPSPGTYREWLAEAGFRIRREEVLEDSAGERHPVLLARRVA